MVCKECKKWLNQSWLLLISFPQTKMGHILEKHEAMLKVYWTFKSFQSAMSPPILFLWLMNYRKRSSMLSKFTKQSIMSSYRFRTVVVELIKSMSGFFCWKEFRLQTIYQTYCWTANNERKLQNYRSKRILQVFFDNTIVGPCHFRAEKPIHYATQSSQ